MNYLDDVWYCSALSREATTAPLARMICELPIVIYRSEGGKIVALEDRCAHRHAPLSRGRVLGEDIECAYHGFTFDCSGACVHIPHQEIIPKAARVRVYPAVERWGYVWLWLGAAEKADPALLPDLPWTEDPAFRTVYFYFPVRANFQLMADNLMDVSHTEFLHRTSIGSQTGRKGQADMANVELDCRADGDRVHFLRTVRNTALGPVAAKWVGSDKPVTRTNTLLWEAPNTVHSILQFENEEARSKIHMEHIMTPGAANETHYFMNWTRDFGLTNVGYPTDEDITREQTGVVAGEDIPMVEAQQQNIALFGDVRDIASSQDRFITSVHRTLAGLYKRARKPVPLEVDRTALRKAS
jgi:vanillate O-demethylase monooxygenase subunit